MSTVIAHNIPAINTQKNLYQTNMRLNKSLEKLSSGYRINVGADGPADLVISEQLRAQKNGLDRAVRNTTESINVLSIAEGALNEMNSILKKMKALAIHAANNGITSPQQVEADQAELDSGVQTLERIANTTKFSDQFLLNGSKDLTYSLSTEVKGTQNNSLVNQSLSQVYQIFKRDNYAITLGYSGAIGANAVTNIGKANMDKEAQKAYLEIDPFATTKSQVDLNGNLTQGQSFILTGSQGSRQFRFSEGASISQVVSAIKSVAGSTGVDASLTFNRNQTINQTVDVSVANASLGLSGAMRTACTMTVFDNYYSDANGTRQQIVTGVTAAACGIEFGKNTDGQGRIYIKITGANTFELYKDSSLSRQSLVGQGSNGVAITALNNSNLSGLTVNVASAAKYGSVAYMSFGNALLNANSVTVGGVMSANAASTSAVFDAGNSIVSGVQLGTNTSEEGKIYVKVIGNATTACVGTVYAYKDARMRAEDLVAKSADNIKLGASNSVILDAVWNNEHTASTGLGLHLNIGATANFAGLVGGGVSSGEIQFKNLGARIYSSDYGSDAFLKIQQFDGGLFTYYDQKNDYNTATLVGPGSTMQFNGQDATLNVNGQQVKTNGLVLNLATPDIMAKIQFNSGSAGSTTIAQVGYGEGSIFTKNTSLAFDTDTAFTTGANQYFSGLLNNAGHNTNETINHFTGGMQLQLGEGEGDQERTVIAIQSMSTALMGRVQVTKQFDPSKAVVETKTLSMQDTMSGQLASLSNDPVLAMKIIDQAINDVSGLRARIGSVQANMLETNSNNLRVAIENITKTESDIRDTDMAAEMTEFTKDQVLSNAGMSMLAQANSQSQNVLQLLR